MNSKVTYGHRRMIFMDLETWSPERQLITHSHLPSVSLSRIFTYGNFVEGRLLFAINFLFKGSKGRQCFVCFRKVLVSF